MMYTDKNGKQWDVVGIRKPAVGELVVDAMGRVIPADQWHASAFQSVVHPIVPEYITPTDEHAKQRPIVEVRDYESREWLCRRLIYVRPPGNKYQFQTVDKEENSSGWKFCRMRNPEYVDNKGE